MSIDNKIDAVRVVKAETQDASPIAEKLQKTVEYLPGPFSKLAKIALSNATIDRMGQVEYMLRVYGDELKRLDIHLDRLSAAQQTHINEYHADLLRDAALKASDVRGTERVKWLGRIVARGLIEEHAGNPDYTEEMMQIAIALFAEDVLILQQIVEAQIHFLKQNNWNPMMDPVNDSWAKNRPTLPNLKSKGDLYSICSKLERFGLITRVERNNSKLTTNETPYAALRRGVDFLDYIRGAAGE